MNELPKIETFEYDITNEIKTKEANIRDIAASSNSVGTKVESGTAKKTKGLLIASFVLIILSVLGTLGYVFYIQSADQVTAPQVVTLHDTGSKEKDLSNSLPLFYNRVGRFVTKAEQTPSGYNLTITSYSEVFAFMLKNENAFAKELAPLLKVKLDSQTGTTTPQLIFTDMTVSNQNMRVLSVGSSTLIYSFLNTDHLLLSTTPEGILAMRSAILK